MNVLAADINEVIGQISPPVGGMGQNPVSDLGSLISLVLRIFFIIVGFFVLIYLFIGAFEVITSGGDKEKLSKAQNKITNAIVGLILVIAAIAVFGVIAGEGILGIIKNKPGGWEFNIPSLNP